MKDFYITLKDEKMMRSDEWRKFIDFLNESLIMNGLCKFNGRDVAAHYGISEDGVARCSWNERWGKEITLEQWIRPNKFYIDI